MTTTNNFSTARCKSALLAGALFSSVVLNLFLVGILAGAIPGAKHKSFAPMALAAPHGEYLVDGMTRYLDQSDAAAFREAVQSQSLALKQGHDQVRQATKDVASIFELDPPDPAALQAAFDHLNEAKVNVGVAVKDVAMQAYAKLTPEGRHRLSELTR